jgi:Zn-dependent M28 family amino/carboxypeptidase
VNFITATLRGYGLTVSLQNFTGASGEGAGIPFVNIAAVLKANYTASKRIILAAHYDTRPFSDHDLDGRTIVPDYQHPVPGANDGASGVAVLIELAKAMLNYNRTRDIYFLFLDGEDYGTNEGSMLYGSKYYASHMSQAEVDSTDYMVLLDMIGDKELTIYREINSDNGLMDKIFSKAVALKVPQFIDTTLYAVIDDHIAFKDRGIKAVDLIDFDYPNTTANYWHTPSDTIDKVSVASLGAVGRVVEGFMNDTIVSHPAGSGNNNTTKPPPIIPPDKPKPFIPGFEMLALVPAIIIIIMIRYRRTR